MAYDGELREEFIEVTNTLEAALATLRREHVALLARVEQLTRRVTDLEGSAVYHDEPDIDPPDDAYDAALADEEWDALGRSLCRHCSKPVVGGNEHEDCRINERELWGPGGRPEFRY